MSLISAFRPRSARTSSIRRGLRRIAGGGPKGTAHRKTHPKAFWALRGSVSIGSPLRSLRLAKQDFVNLRGRYLSDWTVFNQLVFTMQFMSSSRIFYWASRLVVTCMSRQAKAGGLSR
ncbi:uncharacterized protein ATNIH1004_005809 [Aspergillus tanneri]|uniref:Uncharacterized protein n=1 Tax=Aspergillus tanneri TaxID=1220188 RepID=A0A5M9MMJ9_9EURO|nr:uncharacterized protein ATNIH1004_005809 [Aspergillus tanneri]KAA8647126.1 hypothetical protein ATNIH1004_005809 [Aspergillus tanneri]